MTHLKTIDSEIRVRRISSFSDQSLVRSQRFGSIRSIKVSSTTFRQIPYPKAIDQLQPNKKKQKSQSRKRGVSPNSVEEGDISSLPSPSSSGGSAIIDFFKRAWQKMRGGSEIDEGEEESHDYYEYSELEELETPPRYRPDSLSALCRVTRFSEAELKRIYRGFKAECPTGMVREDTFKVIYSQFFPQGANSGLYAHYVFNTLDPNRTGIVSFEDFVLGLSILSRGSLEERLRWTFSLYDINGDGFITREEMTDIVTAIYDLAGMNGHHQAESGVVGSGGGGGGAISSSGSGGSGTDSDGKIKAKVERIFQKMDLNRDGVVTLDEFLECCRHDETITQSMTVFDSSF